MAEEESFKVTDRRGQARDSTTPEPPTTPSIGAPSPAAQDAGVGSQARPPGAAPAESRKLGLQDLFAMLATSAMINLGETADPDAGERAVDLDQAREAIDLLLLLRDKTQGNRTEEESRLLEQVLYDLQMRFVQAARRSTRV